MVDLRKRHSPSHSSTPPLAHDRSLVPRHTTPPAGVELDLRVKVGESSRHLGTPPSQHHRSKTEGVDMGTLGIIVSFFSSPGNSFYFSLLHATDRNCLPESGTVPHGHDPDREKALATAEMSVATRSHHHLLLPLLSRSPRHNRVALGRPPSLGFTRLTVSSDHTNAQPMLDCQPLIFAGKSRASVKCASRSLLLSWTHEIRDSWTLGTSKRGCSNNNYIRNAKYDRIHRVFKAIRRILLPPADMRWRTIQLGKATIPRKSEFPLFRRTSRCSRLVGAEKPRCVTR